MATIPKTRTAAKMEAERRCPVCHQDFAQPKLLPCAHVVCRDCVVSLLQAQADACCPVCRCAIAEPLERTCKCCEALAGLLPTDLTMESLVEAARTLGSRHVCRVCVHLAAVAICLHCGDLFCNACTKVHQKQSVSRDHKVEELAALTTERLSAGRLSTCSLHVDKTCDLYCPTHGTAICHACAVFKHRGCREVRELQERVEEARGTLGELAAKIKTGESELERAMKQLDQHLAQTEKKTKTALASIDAVCDRLRSSVDRCRARLREMVLHARDEASAPLQERRQALAARRAKLGAHRLLAERARRAAPPRHLDDVIQMLQKRVKGLNDGPGDAPAAELPSMLTLQIDAQAILRIERELENLGHMAHGPALMMSLPISLYFHDNHGENITLSFDRQTAEKIRGRFDGIVVACEEMASNSLYEVRLEELDDEEAWEGNSLVTGVTVAHPSQLVLPVNASYWKDAIAVWGAWVDHLGTRTSCDVGEKLLDMAVGGRVGVLVDTARRLHLYVDGRNQGVVARDVPQPCHAFFYLKFQYKKVTAQPVRVAEGRDISCGHEMNVVQ